MNDLESLFLTELRDIYDAEHQLAGALAELERYSTSKLLKLAFGHHQKQTEKHFKRLEKAFRELGQAPHRKACLGVEGIIDEAQTLVEEFMGNPALDAALIAAGQKAEHYEICAYGTLCTWAKQLGHDRVLELLKDNLSEPFCLVMAPRFGFPACAPAPSPPNPRLRCPPGGAYGEPVRSLWGA